MFSSDCLNEFIGEHFPTRFSCWTRYGARGVRDAVREAITAATVYDRNIGRYKGRKVTLSGDIENIVITIVPEEDTALPAGA